MSEESIKKRQRDAKEAAISKYKKLGYDIIYSNNEKICFSASRRFEIRFVRVVIDEISNIDKRIMEEIESPENCNKEIMCRPYKEHQFIHIELKPKKGWQEIIPKT